MGQDGKQGILIVYTGEGKGKSTAAFGLVVRTLGQNGRVCIIQFIKSPEYETGEAIFFRRQGVEIYPLGSGFTNAGNPEAHRDALKSGWQFAKGKLLDQKYDLVVLDELNSALSIADFPVRDILPLAEVLETVQKAKKDKHIVITGRNAPEAILAAGDLVTEMRCLKHDFHSGRSAKKGIEY